MGKLNALHTRKTKLTVQSSSYISSVLTDLNTMLQEQTFQKHKYDTCTMTVKASRRNFTGPEAQPARGSGLDTVCNSCEKQ